MKFDKPNDVDSLCYEFKLADFPRAQNRARINSLFNGGKPYTDEEAEENGIVVNVNDLSATRLAHDARSQFYGAFLKPGKFFTATCDSGPKHKRGHYGEVLTKHAARVMKDSMEYFETFRSKFASSVLHGIGPAVWDGRDRWCPDPVGIEDVLVPNKTLLTCRNLPFFAIYRSYTAPELIRMTRGPNVDPGWNMKLVKACLSWIDSETARLATNNWPEYWSPEKLEERMKEDGACYASDMSPTVDVFDFYFHDDTGDDDGWYRRMILDTWGSPMNSGGVNYMNKNPDKEFGRNEFLYNSGNRKYADSHRQIFSVQFADLSAVAPFRWHTVRSLGWMLYAPCHLYNRMRCKFNESVFEALMMYFKVKNSDDVQRALKMQLVSRGFIDDTLTPLTAAERYQVNTGLVQLGLAENQRLIDVNASSYTQDMGAAGSDRTQKTKFQVMAELNAMNTLVSAAFQQAYTYQLPEYNEILRRLCNPDSNDPAVLKFRAGCLRDGLPEKMLCPEYWDLTPERVMGAGNQTLEMAISQQLMEWRPLYDPEPQREILRRATFAISGDPGLSESLVPTEPLKISDSVHDAQLASGALMQGLPVAVKTGQNHQEVVATLLVNLQLLINQAMQQGGMMPMEKIMGCARIAEYAKQHLAIMAQDKNSKALVAAFEKQLSKLENELRAFVQRLQQAAQKAQQQQGGNGGLDPKDAAKIQATIISAQTKAKLQTDRSAQRAAHDRLKFERQIQQQSVTHQQDMAMESAKAKLEIAKEAEKAKIQLAATRLKSMKSKVDETGE